MHKNININPQYKTFFPEITPEQIIELSFEYFEKIDLSILQIDKNNKSYYEITTKSGLLLLYIIDSTPDNYSFFAIPIGSLNN